MELRQVVEKFRQDFRDAQTVWKGAQREAKSLDHSQSQRWSKEAAEELQMAKMDMKEAARTERSKSKAMIQANKKLFRKEEGLLGRVFDQIEKFDEKERALSFGLGVSS